MTEPGWPDDWADRMAGKGCPMCATLGKGDNDFSVEVFTGDAPNPYPLTVIPTTVKRPRAFISAGVGRRDLVLAFQFSRTLGTPLRSQSSQFGVDFTPISDPR